MQEALASTGERLVLDIFQKVDNGIRLHIFKLDESGAKVAEWYDGYLTTGGQPLQGDYGSIDTMPKEHRAKLYTTLLSLLHL